MTFITERCVIELEMQGLVVTEIAPGIRLKEDVLDQSAISLLVSPDLQQMDAQMFLPELMHLELGTKKSPA